MSKAAPEWTDARLNDLAAALHDVPQQLAVLNASVAHFEQLAADTEPMRAQLAALTVSVNHLANENRTLRTELAAIQLQLVQISWGLVAALIGAGTAVITALM
jgi:deoxyribodipyrimidine photolyase